MMGESGEIVEQSYGPLWECFEPVERSSLYSARMLDARLGQVEEEGKEEGVVWEKREGLNVGTSL